MKVLGNLLAIVLLSMAVAGCSVRQLAAGIVADSMSGERDVYAADDDPELVRDAIPFGLKTYEGLLEAAPENRQILLSLARGFAVYAYLLQQDADRIAARDREASAAMRQRASRLYLRGRDYALRGLALAQPGFDAEVRRDAASAAARIPAGDIAFLYWVGASWAAAVGANPGDLGLVAELPIAGALMQRVLALDEGYDRGAAHEFFISFEGNRPGGSLSEARRHFERALALSGGTRASVYLALAEAVAVREQNLAEFRSLVAAALAIDPDADSSQRLANVVAQRRAQWLRAREAELFVVVDPEVTS
jgi:predicted anti-sigma-YlaC factor YlaD